MLLTAAGRSGVTKQRSIPTSTEQSSNPLFQQHNFMCAYTQLCSNGHCGLHSLSWRTQTSPTNTALQMVWLRSSKHSPSTLFASKFSLRACIHGEMCAVPLRFWLRVIKRVTQLWKPGQLMTKVLRNPGHGHSRCCIVGNWTHFSFLKTVHLSSKRLLQF